MENYQDYFEANRVLWNKRTAIHKDASFYDRDGFKNGKEALTPIELRELGQEVHNKKMLHLQCHFGMDSLGWQRKGASVTGIDLSDEAISEARKLNEELGLSARFVCCNLYDIEQHVHDRFGIVFTSYGAVGWLPDLDRWAAIIARYLVPGGIFYIAEFHPVIWMFDDDFTNIQHSYENRGTIVTESQGTYANRQADIKEKEYSWNHSLGEVINALIRHGLIIESLNEHMSSPYPCFNKAVPAEGGWQIKGLENKIPMVYSIRARKAL